MNHTHDYDAQGKQLCCTEENKINAQADALIKNKPVKDSCCATDDHDQHSDDDGHDHTSSSDSNFKLFLPAAMSLIALLIALILDNYVTQTWFTGWLRIGWYVAAYLPVGLPVLREAVKGIIKSEIFSEFLLMSIATIGAFAIGEYPEGVAVMLFYSVGEVFQTLAVKRAKTNIKSLLDQRPDEVTVIRNNQATTLNAETVNIGDIIQLKAGEKLGLDGELLSAIASFNTAALTGESKPEAMRFWRG
jgi:Cd2+/Zn2+-exporting ATPase